MKFRSFTKAIFTLCISFCILVASNLFASTAIAGTQGLTYDQIVNTGLANKCPDILGSSRGGRNFIPLGAGETAKITELCLEQHLSLLRKNQLITNAKNLNLSPVNC